MRRFLQLLPVCATLVLAHSDGGAHVHSHKHHDGLAQVEICGEGSLIPGSDGLCSFGAAAEKVDNVDKVDKVDKVEKIVKIEKKEQQIVLNGDGGSQGAAATGDEKLVKGHTWTHSEPCFTSSRSNQTFCAFTDAKFAVGRGTSLVMTAARANYMATTPAFVDADLVKDTNQDLVRTVPAKYEMREFPGKGMGLVAKGFIRRGELIMANTPSLMIDYQAFEELSKDEYRQLQASAVEHLPPAHRDHVLALSTHDDVERTYLERVDKIAATNAFDIDPDADDADQDHGFYVVFPEIARMNHDCRPNGDYFFDHSTMTHAVHAIRDIAPGEELTLSYINPAMRREARMRKLESTWGFRCDCYHCTQEAVQAAASDDRLGQIEDLQDEFRNWKATSRASPSMADLLISLYQQEKLWASMYEAYAFAALEHNAVGEAWTAIKYARLAIEWGLPVVGAKDSDMRQMTKLADDPWSHWSWMLRVKRRAGVGRKKKQDDESDGSDDDE